MSNSKLVEVFERKEEAMTNCYEAPEFIELGKAQSVILDQKQSANRPDSFGVLATEAPTIDDFDE